MWYNLQLLSQNIVHTHTHTHKLLIASTLSRPMLKDLVLLPIINWFDLGLQLNISEDNLNIIKQNNPNDTKACRREMFSAWLEIDPDASYRQLVDALHTMGFHNIAEQLCAKYGTYILHRLFTGMQEHIRYYYVPEIHPV